MNCKNCATHLTPETFFCNFCGAKIITNRTTIKGLVKEVTNNIFGWDNTFFFTVKKLLVSPQLVFKEYIDGTRKKYMNPFTILGITSALAIFIFNFYADDYLAMNMESNKQTVSVVSAMMEQQLGADFDKETYQKEQLENITRTSDFMLTYFNLLVIAFMPIYTFFAFMVYGKPYNYAEHLIINSYIQSISFLVTSIIFTISVFTNPSVYFITILFLIFYYTYAYGKLYQLGTASSILKLLIFLGILFIGLLIIGILSLLLGIAIAYLNHH